MHREHRQLLNVVGTLCFHQSQLPRGARLLHIAQTDHGDIDSARFHAHTRHVLPDGFTIHKSVLFILPYRPFNEFDCFERFVRVLGCHMIAEVEHRTACVLG